jgi:hypothetical protein
MFKMFAMAGLAALVAACAAPPPVAAGDPLRAKPGSAARGEATAAEIGFHGPVYRSKDVDGPN